MPASSQTRTAAQAPKSFDNFTGGRRIAFMKILPAVLIVAALTFSTATQAAPPSDASVARLLEVSQAGKMMDSVFDQMDGFMKNSMRQVTKGKPLSAEEQAVMDRQQSKMIAIMKEEFSWAKMKEPFTKIYRETFTQEEVDGLIAFYESPAGKALINKQPELMKNTMAVMQERMMPVMQKIQKMSEETAKELKSAKAQK
jgi:uncharacterized protein